MFPVHFKTSHPGSHRCVLAVVQFQNPRVLRNESDQFSAQDVTSAEGVWNVSITEFVARVSPFPFSLHRSSSVKEAPVQKRVFLFLEFLNYSLDINKCIIVTFENIIESKVFVCKLECFH